MSKNEPGQRRRLKLSGVAADPFDMSGSTNKPKPIKLADVCYYFDGLERDRLDAGGLSRKAGEVLALRNRLLRLSDADFDAAIKTMRSLVDEQPVEDRDQAAKKRASSLSLYDEVRPTKRTGAGASAKVSAT